MTISNLSLTQRLNALTIGHPAATLAGKKKNEQRTSLQPSDTQHGGVNALPDPSRAHVASRVALRMRAVPAHAAVEVGEGSAALAKRRDRASNPAGFRL